ncbi:hypothetical protein O6H91_05G042100 [Diphasiastrum complanatum]|uniref:Uncharacterized protein n=1 Tax=Diphasiastrum complanatum TaxID=34168 RepID=A0ACC2DMV5_DIPCM|nr:hypothetical protein O6H91_05G042100 [Diphasiastrum complanatum]
MAGRIGARFGSRSLLGDEEGGEGGKAEELRLTVNEAYAKRFVHNKEREDLHRLQELQKRGLINSESDTEDDEDEDEDGVLPERVDLQLFDTLTKIKKKDPQIYRPDAVFFDEVQEVDEEENKEPNVGAEEQAEKKKKKPAFLKDVIASQLLEGGAEDHKQAVKPRVSLTYAQEQQELKHAFLRSVAEADEDEGGLLRVRKKSEEEIATEKLEDEAAVVEYEQRQKDTDINRRLEDYFGKSDDLDENERFLKDFLLNKGWIDRDQNRIPSYHEIVDDVSEDEEELEKQEKFEAGYNFRFEEGAGSQVLGHSRVIETSVRKKSDIRKRKRKLKMERFEEAAQARQEELKRLKNLKKKEILEKLSKIRSVAGVASDSFATGILDEDDLEEDFDPDDYDRKMRDAFGDMYYNDRDADSNFMADEAEDVEKPDFDAEDELLGLVKDWDGKKRAGFAAIREQKKGNAPEDEIVAGNKRKKFKHNISLREKLSFDKQLEDYYKLDYEDMIGDMPTRFKYHQVQPNTYGMTSEEILTTDDKELNQYVSIKKLAPYRSDEWEPARYHHMSKKTRKLHSLDQVPSYHHNGVTDFSKKKKSLKLQGDGNENIMTDAVENGNKPEEKTNEAVTKKRKRRRKASIAPMSFSRLLSYGKISFPAGKQRKVH